MGHPVCWKKHNKNRSWKYLGDIGTIFASSHSASTHIQFLPPLTAILELFSDCVHLHTARARIFNFEQLHFLWNLFSLFGGCGNRVKFIDRYFIFHGNVYRNLIVFDILLLYLLFPPRSQILSSLPLHLNMLELVRKWRTIICRREEHFANFTFFQPFRRNKKLMHGIEFDIGLFCTGIFVQPIKWLK